MAACLISRWRYAGLFRPGSFGFSWSQLSSDISVRGSPSSTHRVAIRRWESCWDASRKVCRVCGAHVCKGQLLPCLSTLTRPTSPVYQPESKTLCQSSMSTGLALPPELWGLTLNHLCESKREDELTYLWTTLRHVCRHFKAIVEDVFRTQHLPRTFLHFNSGRPI